MEKANRLDQRYAVLNPKGASELWDAADFWKMVANPADPRNSADMGYLVSHYEFTQDWESWENHPSGDELVFCSSGQMTFVLELDGKAQEVPLTAGQFVIVPKNTWHTAKVQEKAQALFITWGFGTMHRKA
ncbi:cupin domain-containing protein [Oligoflexus tunisiensis]|uniref:cupin domain-containing protein n=1 Tax=Oligoflexus tunisiensis TaxID=708132 RepID=UPI00114CB391|nr:cupin domain-containing protein [Oligoflexus tunisiensis]